jgi:two-component system, NarL family, nitrate/nitrite response regulator NarL
MLSVSVSENEWSKVLSPRERAVALLIAGGLSNKEVARELGLSLGTVKIHVHNIFQKLGVNNRRHLIIQHGTRVRAAGPAVVGGVKSPPA